MIKTPTDIHNEAEKIINNLKTRFPEADWRIYRLILKETLQQVKQEAELNLLK